MTPGLQGRPGRHPRCERCPPSRGEAAVRRRFARPRDAPPREEAREAVAQEDEPVRKGACT